MPKSRSFCFHCGGSNDWSSNICTRPACLAWYWRDQAEKLEQKAREYRQMAERIERDATALAAPVPAASEGDGK